MSSADVWLLELSQQRTLVYVLLIQLILIQQYSLFLEGILVEHPMLVKSVSMELQHVHHTIHFPHVSQMEYQQISVMRLMLLVSICVNLNLSHVQVQEEAQRLQLGVVVPEYVEMEYLDHLLEKSVM
jgi:hypothetical protein